MSTAAFAQQAPGDPAIIPQQPLVLATMTPLGKAEITLPAGKPLPNYRIEGKWITVISGPFSAKFPLAEVVPPPPPPTPQSAPVKPAPIPEPPTFWQAGLDALQKGDPLALLAAGVAAAVAGYALLMTVLWWQLRRKVAQLEDAG